MDRLSREADRLRRSCRRLIWLNPLLRFDGFSARARGVRALLPHVDEFRSAHSLDTLSQLCAALSSETRDRDIDPRLWLRPARRHEERRMNQPTNILAVAERWADEGRRLALATVIETWGSAPRPVGSHLVIDDEGGFEGSVSGGCVEGAVIAEALEVIESGTPKMLEFGVADETAWRVGLSCGGRIRVYLEKVG